MKLLKDNKKLIFIIILVFIVGGLTGVVAYSVYANTVTYDNTQSGLQSTNVQDALDELYTKANTWINPSYIDFTTLATNTNKTILASKNGICIKRNNKVSCFKVNNWSEEKNHIQQVFSDVSCSVLSSYVRCIASDFFCYVDSNGYVYCRDRSDDSDCGVYTSGSINCN